MRRNSLVFALAAVVSLATGPAPAQEETARTPEPMERFRGETTFLRDGEAQAVGVDLQKWIIDGGQKLDALELPAPGLLIVQLAAGSITTVIDGERQERAEGEFWHVAEGKPMGVETGDDSAILLTIVVTGK